MQLMILVMIRMQSAQATLIAEENGYAVNRDGYHIQDESKMD